MSLSIFLISCYKDIDMDIENATPKLVINTFLSPDFLFEISVTSSLHILESTTIIYVEDATVKISEGGVLLEVLEYNENSHKYASNDLKPEPGKIYHIEVSAPHYETVVSETSLPFPVTIESIDTFLRQSFENNLDGEKIYNFVLKVNINDPGNEENYYLMCIENPSVKYLTPDTSIQESKYAISTYDFYINNILIELTSSTSFSGSLFSGFSLVNNDEDIEISPKRNKYLFANFIAFSDIAFNGKQASFELELPDNMYEDTSQYNVRLISISKDYYKYITSEALYFCTDRPFSEKARIYCNVKNGLGIVLACSMNSKSIIRKHNMDINSTLK